MRVIVAGTGVQGKKRALIAKSDLVATVDPFASDVTYRTIYEVPLADYDAAILCVPDKPKIELIEYLLENRKHVLVEKPLFSENSEQILLLKQLAEKNQVTCYTAYNHRFEPHFIRAKEIIESGRLGRIYVLKLFYGNGTARLVRDSVWRDKDAGVLPDLGSRLLDTSLFWLGKSQISNFRLYASECFENNAPDYVSFGSNSNGGPSQLFEVSLLSWRNHFTADIIAENGSVHIESLCKWGPAKMVIRDRQLPSGRPNEEIITLINPDPTWSLEYDHFKNLCKKGSNNLENDMWINEVLGTLRAKIYEKDRRKFG